jgi:Ca2+-transporting ATPase
MDTFAALALATDPADPENLNRKPDKKLAPLISADMWKMIIGQSIFQLTVALVLHFKGADILGYGATERVDIQIQQEAYLKTLIFNQFVFCQIFNMLNARKLDRTLNILRGVYKNYYFMIIWAIMIGGQALIVNVGGSAFQVTRIPGNLWAISIIIGLVSLPVGVIVRLLPTAPFERFLIRYKLLPDPNALPTTDPNADDSEKSGLEKLGDNLAVYSKFRGGRVNAANLIKRKRKVKKLDEKEVFPTSLMAMVPSMIMAMPGAGGQQLMSGTLANPAGMAPSPSSEHLYRGEPAVHGGTSPSDPIAQRFPGAGMDAGRSGPTLTVPGTGSNGLAAVRTAESDTKYSIQ